MTTRPEELVRLKEKLEAAKREGERAAGALEQVMKRLSDEYGCKDLPAAEKLLERLKRQEAADAQAFDEALQQFRKDHPDFV